MARVFKLVEATQLDLPGRKSLEILSGKTGTHSATLRLVEIPVETGSGPNRSAHAHADFEECIFVVSGSGTTHADSGDYTVSAGDTIWIPAGEKHFTRNTGIIPLRLLCFFPVADISSDTTEPSLGPNLP